MLSQANNRKSIITSLVWNKTLSYHFLDTAERLNILNSILFKNTKFYFHYTVKWLGNSMEFSLER